MTTETYFKVLNLFDDYINLCAFDAFDDMELSAKNNALLDFIEDYNNCCMDAYTSVLLREMACTNSWSDKQYKTFATLLYCFNLHSQNMITY